jgi:uncharacterized protein YjdB
MKARIDRTFGLLACVVALSASACKSSFGEYANAADPTASNYQGYESVAATGILLKGPTTVALGYTQRLTPAYTPENGTTKSLGWSSSAPSVATVDSSGLVKGLALGTVTITATTAEGLVDKTDITVITPVPVTGLSLDTNVKSILAGATFQLTATIVPTNATVMDITWSSSNSAVATVSSAGLVTGVSEGSATITATSDYSASYGASCALTVTTGVPTDGLMGEWLFASNAKDTSGFGNNGTVSGATLTSDRFEKASCAYSFDGSNYIVIGDPVPSTLQIKNAITISAWIYATSYPDSGSLWMIAGSQYDVDKSGASIFLDGRENIDGTNPSGHIHFQIGNGSWHVSNNNSTVSLNKWVHIVATRKANEAASIYMDGIAQDVTSIDWDGSINYTSYFAIGGQKDYSNRYFQGKLDDVRIYNRALSASEIGKLYADGGSVPVAVTDVTLSSSTASIYVGASTQLTATIAPTTATNTAITWASSNTAAATVSSSGLVTGVAAGTATISATSANGKTASCVVTVSNIAVTSVTLNASTAKITVGSTSQLTATIAPTTATIKTVSWTSSNTSIATVSSTGLVTGVAAGSATITATSTSGSKTATCAVTIYIPVPVTSVSLSASTATIAVGYTSQLTATAAPATATTQTVSWSSSATSVATVNSTGLVTGMAAGSATITVTTLDGGYTASCVVTVQTIAVTGVALSASTATIAVGYTSQLTATITPTNATNQSFTWTSSNTSAATVSSAGLVTGVAAGTATITVTTADGNKTATCAITAQTVAVTGVSLSSSSSTISLGYTSQLVATVSPTNATNKTFAWSSSNTSIATVSNTGLVTGIAVGSSTITVTTDDGTHTATCAISIIIPVTGISLNASSLSVSKGATSQLTASITPSNATTTTVTWASSNTSVATVSDAGLITGISGGTATITSTTSDGAFTASCAVTVPYSVGDIGPAGGIVCYDKGSVTTDTAGNSYQFLECAPSDQSTGIGWANTRFISISTGTAIGTGAKNTANIVATQETGSYAAQLCNDLTLGGYSDWFLPSKSELALMYTNLKATGLGSFTTANYWSSSQYNDTYAWLQQFNDGTQYSGYSSTAQILIDKSWTLHVRAIREFK